MCYRSESYLLSLPWIAKGVGDAASTVCAVRSTERFRRAGERISPLGVFGRASEPESAAEARDNNGSTPCT